MNIINAAFVRNGVTIRTLPVYQYDSGMILQISGLDDLPSTFRVDFSNAETGQSKSVIGTDGEVHIPYEYFVPGATIHCWLVWSGEDYTVTRKHIMIPVARRATPTDEEPSPEEQGVIDQAIATLNDAVAQTGQNVEAAAGYAEQAEQSAQAATDAKDNAFAAQNAAEAANEQAVQSAANAAASAQSASESAQSASQSKTAAQEAAASVSGAMGTLEATIQADLQAAKESGEFDGKDGYTPVKGVDYFDGEPGHDGTSPTIMVAPISGGHRITITDANGTNTVDVLDGENGDAGRGIVSVQKTGTAGLMDTYTITYTDSTTSTFTVTNGKNGTDGISPTITVTDITGGHRVTITDATGPHSFDVLDGDAADAPVQDVQVNGTSILDAQGVANVPMSYGDGASGVLGVVKTQTYFGIGINDNGILFINPASSNSIKAGGSTYSPLSVKRQHESTFYGLTKAAGVDMASSANPVGTYTDEAKIAIQKMLGIYKSPWEVIRSATITNATEGNITVTVDDNGNAFELTDIAVAFVLSAQENDTASYGEYGRVRYYYDTNSHDDTLSNTISIAVGGSKKGFYSFVEQKDNLLFKHATGQTTIGNGSSENMVVPNNKTSNLYPLNILTEQRVYNKVEFRAVKGIADFVIYGRRKPT